MPLKPLNVLLLFWISRLPNTNRAMKLSSPSPVVPEINAPKKSAPKKSVKLSQPRTAWLAQLPGGGCQPGQRTPCSRRFRRASGGSRRTLGTRRAPRSWLWRSCARARRAWTTRRCRRPRLPARCVLSTKMLTEFAENLSVQKSVEELLQHQHFPSSKRSFNAGY